MTEIKDYYSAVESRRSMYNINDEKIVPEQKIIEIVRHAVKHTPSSFNSQNGRAVILFGENHKGLWDITKNILSKRIPKERFASTEKKLSSFASGYGTILFFEDLSIVENLQSRFPSYANNFPNWSLQSIGILQHIVWTGLELEGLGASLQHYNPLIDEEVKQRWNIQSSWRLVSQMPFGKPIAPADEKQFLPIEERVKIFY